MRLFIQPIALYRLLICGVLLASLAGPVRLQAQDAQPTPHRFAELIATAETQDYVRIIVQLDTAFVAEGSLQSTDAVRRQRATIAQTQQALLNKLAGDRVALIAAWETIPFMALAVDATGLKSLQRSPLVVDIQADRPARPLLDTSTVHVGAPKAWAAGYEGNGQLIVVLDTGIERSHPFFGDRVVEEACFSSSHIRSPDNPPDTQYGTSLCPNGQTSQFGPGAADALIAQCTVGLSWGNRCYHGTPVAGVAAGASPGDVAYNGVARGSDIAAIQVFTHLDNLDECSNRPFCTVSFTSDQISALEYVLVELIQNDGYDVAAVNMSLGGDHYTDQALCDEDNLSRKAAMDNLRSVGVPTIIASGNSGRRDAIAEPACISSAIAVSASVDPYDTISGSASISDMVELMAPGRNVFSAMPSTYPFDYFDANGTSFAAPHVAGAWAILKQIDPDATVDEILTLLQTTGVPIADTRSGGTVTKPRIDLCAALAAQGIASGVDLQVKMMLQGAFRDLSTGSGFLAGALMRDTLRELETADGYQEFYLPHSEPYAAQFGFSRGEQIAVPATTLADHGDDSIVDWVFIELREAAAPATVLATRAALLQRDGDVVDVDGGSAVTFGCTLPGDYYVAVRHRNHLGAMTATPVTLAATGTLVDFTDPQGDYWHDPQSYDGHEQTTLNGLAMLPAGDANQNGAIAYDGAGNDPLTVNQTIVHAPGNTDETLDYVYPGYHAQDVDLSGHVVADAAPSEHDVILDNVLNHPANYLGSQGFLMQEQLARPQQ